MEKVNITIIGAGVIGLAIAAELSQKSRDIILVEKETSFGQHTSSRNSEVIHAGLYYPQDSLKARLCVEGNKLLYAYCEKYAIPYLRLGKLIAALADSEIAQLAKIKQQAEANGVFDLKWLSSAEAEKLEPCLQARAALFSPSTGIVDSHILMKTLERQASEKAVLISYGSEVTAITKTNSGYEIEINGQETFAAEIVINAAGLFSDRIAALAGIELKASGYQLHYCKGEYFSYVKPSFLKHLVYPVPERDLKSLGIHALLDLAGRLKFGPHAEYVKAIDYKVNPADRKIFYQAIKALYPLVEETDLLPDQAGIRPKLQGPGESFRDFVIKEESDKGLPGFIDLIGIESPGLTACLAIGKFVENLIK